MPPYFQHFLKYLQGRLENPLPGEPLQYKMAPTGRKQRSMLSLEKQQPRQAGVLIIFYPHNGHVMTPLILRPEYEGVHSGQVAFPGGGMEEGDVSITATALREAHEEIGIARKEITLLGQLSPLYIPPSNFHVTPILGYTHTLPVFKPDPFEVAEIIEVPLKTLMQDELVREKQITTSNGMKLTTPYYALNQFTIWGATAMMISELVEVMKDWN